MNQPLAGRTAIITGGSRGIGFAVAQRLVADGAFVCITGRNEATLIHAVETLGGPDKAMGVVGKADSTRHQQETVDRILSVGGRLDMLINNVGMNPVIEPLMNMQLPAARKIFEVNSLAPLAWTQAAYSAWMRENGGSVVNITSVGGLTTVPGIGFYGASKAMLCYLTKELAVELAPSIRVNAVAPAVVKTEFAAAVYEGREEAMASNYPLNRLGHPRDIGGAVAFLLSDDASWITGQVLAVDGGITVSDIGAA
ncbi:SDR family oxidoreductase [Nocardia beijingensis]|uniref:SDR family oxidoreductase n=1 Tax=Nocardia beijingensis TaxID=95162 RepID=UPI00189365AF|nr:SDR family oxidoreductase [Nocardia beijingensis]MBF6469992.1 SDR family oxidoreductase [Nocardia beijingensis]